MKGGRGPGQVNEEEGEETMEEQRKQEGERRKTKSGTHLAASSSSSFLYSPRWLQKIMVSDSWLTHTGHTHMIHNTH